jgi:hypothetical protein
MRLVITIVLLNVILLLMLVFANTYAAETKLHYDDCVKVNKGFYEGCVGRVKEAHQDSNSYTVYLTGKDGDTVFEDMDASNLMAQPDSVCGGK